MEIEKIKEYIREQLSKGLTQGQVAKELSGLAKEKPKVWQIGSDPGCTAQKLAYYMRKWKIGVDGGERVEKPKPDPEFLDFEPKTASSPYVFVAVPQNKLNMILGALA